MSQARRRHLFVATPCYGGMVTQAYMQSVLSLMTRAAAEDLMLSIGLLGQDALITRSRNTLVGRFMASDATDLLFVDADIAFMPDDVLRLLGSGKDVIGGLYPIRAHHWSSSALDRVRHGEAVTSASLDYVGEPTEAPGPDGLCRANFAGTGFLLISRSAITTLIAALPETRCRHGHVASSQPVDDVHALFDCMIDPGSRLYLSEDFAFCARWQSVGGEVWLDTRARLTHCGMSEFVGNPAARWPAAMAAVSG